MSGAHAVLQKLQHEDSLHRYAARALHRLRSTCPCRLVAGLLVTIFITPGLDSLSIVLPIMLLIFLLLVAFGTQIYASGRAAITTATLSALVLAWSMSTTLPIS